LKTKGKPQKIYTEEQKTEVKKAYKEAKNSKEHNRLLCLKLRVLKGLTTGQISEITELSFSTVSHVISVYNRSGIEAIKIKKYGGNHRNMTPEEEKEFLEPFKKQATAGEILEVSEIITAYSKALNKKVAKSTVYNLLHRNGWRKIMPRSKHPKKASDEAIEAYKKNHQKDD